MTDIQQYTAAEIAKIETVKEAAKVKGMADAAVEFYKAQDDHQTSQQAKEISMRSARQAGVILLPPGQGGTTERKQGERTDITSRTTYDKLGYLETLDDAGISEATSRNWQKLARVPDGKFEAYFAEAEYMNWEYSVASLMKFAGEWYGRSDIAEWETPQWLFGLLNKEFKFTLDVCALPENTKCKRYYTPDDDGLKQEWKGTCWMNPPYGSEIKTWMAKAKESALSGATVVCFVPARPDTNWWWDNCIDAEIRFIKGRIEFVGSNTFAPFPSALIIMRPKNKAKVVWWNVQREIGVR